MNVQLNNKKEILTAKNIELQTFSARFEVLCRIGLNWLSVFVAEFGFGQQRVMLKVVEATEGYKAHPTGCRDRGRESFFNKTLWPDVIDTFKEHFKVIRQCMATWQCEYCGVAINQKFHVSARSP